MKSSWFKSTRRKIYKRWFRRLKNAYASYVSMKDEAQTAVYNLQIALNNYNVILSQVTATINNSINNAGLVARSNKLASSYFTEGMKNDIFTFKDSEKEYKAKVIRFIGAKKIEVEIISGDALSASLDFSTWFILTSNLNRLRPSHGARGLHSYRRRWCLKTH